MNDDRPSIAELQRAHAIATDERSDEDDWGRARDQVLDSTPLLIEIAAAALQSRAPCDHPEGRCRNGSHYRGCTRFDGAQRLDAAIAKVRP